MIASSGRSSASWTRSPTARPPSASSRNFAISNGAGSISKPNFRAPSAPAPRLHPNIAEVYRRKVEDLQKALAEDDAGPARELVRGLVEAIVSDS